MALERDLERHRSFTTNDEAFRHFEVARRLDWQLFSGGTATPKAMNQVLEGLDRAIALDPDFMPAHSGRAHVYFNKFVSVNA
jgi:hypothetical protein